MKRVGRGGTCCRSGSAFGSEQIARASRSPGHPEKVAPESTQRVNQSPRQVIGEYPVLGNCDS
jgi:hypothetical protein